MKVSELKDYLREEVIDILSEQEEEVEDVDVDVDVDVDEKEKIDVKGDDEVVIKDRETLPADEEAVQKSLKAAYDAAKVIGDDILTNQIANTITYFTRNFVIDREMNERKMKKSELKEIIKSEIHEGLPKGFYAKKGIGKKKKMDEVAEYVEPGQALLTAMGGLTGLVAAVGGINQLKAWLKKNKPEAFDELRKVSRAAGGAVRRGGINELVGGSNANSNYNSNKDSNFNSNANPSGQSYSGLEKFMKEDVQSIYTRMSEAKYPFEDCVEDNEGKYGEKGAKRICGAIRAYSKGYMEEQKKKA